MPAYKDKNTGKWYISFYYEDWDARLKRNLKGGSKQRKRP